MNESAATSIRPLTIANLLTYSRMLLLPFVLAGIVTNRPWLAVTSMALVLMTDQLDGRIARRMKQASTFGQTLDSTVDFVVIYSLFIAFYAAGRLATYQFAFIYLAMITMFTLQILSMATSQIAQLIRMKTGKFTGALQSVYLLFLFVREVLPISHPILVVDRVFFAALAAAIVVSSVDCILKLRVMLSEMGGSGGPANP